MSEKRLSEKDLKNMIVQSARDIEIPKELAPDQMKDRLLQKRRRRRRVFLQRTVAAASLCLCFLGAGMVLHRLPEEKQTIAKEQSAENLAGSKETAGAKGKAEGTEGKAEGSQGAGAQAEGSQAEGAQEKAGSQGTADTQAKTDSAWKTAGTQGGSADARADAAEGAQDAGQDDVSVKNLGKLYTQADSYAQVYALVAKTQADREEEYRRYDYAAAESAEDTADGMAGQSAGAAVSKSSSDAAINGSADSMANGNAAGTTEDGKGGDYSITNLQVEGVDESDIVKTDGKYLYIVQEQQVKILDVRKGVPKLAYTLNPKGIDDDDWIRDMYVADGRLSLVAESYDTQLSSAENEEVTYGDGLNSGIIALDDVASYDLAYNITRQVVTKVLTYDLSNPRKPAYLDTATQDGGYQTSRKVGEYLYLFTRNFLSVDEREDGKKEDGSWLPKVDGEMIPTDGIYLPKRGTESLTMSCMRLGTSHEVTDVKLLLNEGAQFYVTKDSVYIYNTVYDFSSSANMREKTQLARFALTGAGKIRAVAAKTVRGAIEDTFALSEQDGYLRVLTSVTDTQTWENRVYVLDAGLKTVGKLTGIAKGERIYAARFLGKLGYFVTYRNTDPLFTVDFSDPANPTILSEWKISGFSEYLHFWSDDRLLGIGYETDEKTGQTKGLKITMFDISDPANVKAEASKVLTDAEFSPALYDYKTVLIDRKKNMIAFTTENYSEYHYNKNYRVFSYKNGKFKERLTEVLDQDESTDMLRSVYVKDVLYLAGPEKTLAFDRKQGYKKLGEVEYE